MQQLAWDSMCQPSAQPPSGPPPLPSNQQPACLKVSLWCGQHTLQKPLPTGLTMNKTVPFTVAAPRFFCLLGSQWGPGMNPSSQKFTDIGQRQEVVGGGDFPASLSQGHLHIFDYAPSSFLCRPCALIQRILIRATDALWICSLWCRA